MNIWDVVRSIMMAVPILVGVVLLFQEKRAGCSACPSLPQSRRKIIELLQEEFDAKRDLRICELGCGWGGLVRRLATGFPRAQVTGYEISFFPYWVAKTAFCLSKRVKIRKEDFFLADLSGYDAVICYLTPTHLEKLKPQLSGLKAGSLVVTNSFAIPGWTPVKILDVHFVVDIPIYLYKI